MIRSKFRNRGLMFVMCAMVTVFAAAGSVSAGVLPPPGVVIEFDTSLQDFTLQGPNPFPIPLASDPTNNLGDSIDGYGFVDSQVTVTLSSMNGGTPSLGKACAYQNAQGRADRTGCGAPSSDPIDPDALDGTNFIVDSFFDVFFDITVTDVDPRSGRDYAGQPDCASIVLPEQGAEMRSISDLNIFDADAFNFGLIPPPEGAPYIGHFDVVIPLGADINGNGELDKMKFTLVTHSVGDGNRTFIQLPDGTVLDEFDSGAFLEGAILDVIDDPPFIIGAMLPNGLPDMSAFGGRTTATSLLLTPVVPEPTTLALGLIGMLPFTMRRR